MADDPKITQRYRELGREEPPRHLDDAILAASRRAVSGKKGRSWYVPLAAAAILVLAVAVTLQVERERPPDAEMAVVQAPAPASAPAPAPAPAQDQLAVAPPPKEAPPQAEARQRFDVQRQAAEDEARVARSEAAERAPAAPRAGAAASMMKREARVAAAVAASPEQLLQGIADLRRQGRHEEADKALAEFRRAYPDYQISEEMRAKVEREPVRAR